jgi:hypothetical protein
MSPADVAKSCLYQPDPKTGVQPQIVLGKDTIINPAGITLLCRRNRDQQVSVAVNAKEAVGAGALNPGLSLPADPVQWHLLMGTADDAADCVLTSPTGAAVQQFNANLSSPVPPRVDDLTPFLTKGLNRLACHGKDSFPDAGGKACWHFIITVFRNGDVYWDPSIGCCGNDSCGPAPIPGSQGVGHLAASVDIPVD